AAEKFVEIASPFIPSISLESVNFLHRQNFIDAQEFPHYDKCIENGWLVPASQVDLTSEILFISHRWSSLESPDPTMEQYHIAVHFLEQLSAEEINIEYIWIE
ncbi:unnamed protein product, partial [Heterosigma akashiwo]